MSISLILAEIKNFLCIVEATFEDFEGKPVSLVFGELGSGPDEEFKLKKWSNRLVHA